ncbi:Retrotransposon gag protein [Gossypium australe]|uniref:Retrotransposon gag protein n=1 Tax=Gossypium australe TaxID=47621 RepID=A0A5B6VA99_9ROSI|nr:Retrotransposon gag protein [Gossypium australe]
MNLLENSYRSVGTLQNVDSKIPLPKFPEWMRFHIFYNGLDANVKFRLDRAAGGALMNRTYEDAYEIIENMALNYCQ